MTTITAIGVDMALANMGLVRATIDLKTLEINPVELKLVTTKANSDKQVRKSSSEMERARHLGRELVSFSVGASVAFAEVPSGSQSASAARALGIAVGVLSQCPLPMVEVSPMEVKQLFANNRSVSKAEIINWAVNRWPDADWNTVRRKQKTEITQNNEHLADACATIAAGIKTQQFKLITALYHETAMPRYNRSASGRVRQRIVSLESLSLLG